MEVHATIKDICNVIECRLNALIISPNAKRILYLESALSSDSSAHALMGCVSDDNGSKEWRFYHSPKRYDTLTAPVLPGTNDFARQLHGFNRRLHHVAIVERSGELILAKDSERLWRKLRSTMSCPTLESWGEKIMPAVLSSGLLIRCESFGIGAEYVPYVLAENADAKFDNIVGDHVRSIGGIPRRLDHAVPEISRT